MLFTKHTLCTCGLQHFSKQNVLVEGQKIGTYPGLNHVPFDLQSDAVPLSYMSMCQPV